MVYAYDPSYLGGGDQEDDGWRLAQAKVSKTPSQPINQSVVVHACDPSYAKGIGRRITVQAEPGKKCKTLPEK
jgi:hypothetical protein